jgi:uncharacterized protein DUF6551
VALSKQVGEVATTAVRFGGQVQMLKLEQLIVDARFQRPIQQSRVERYTKQFEPKLVGLLTVSLRANGKYVILDGQHRWMVLVERGYTEALCEVLTGLTFEQEAAIFHGRNISRTRLKPGDYFRARLAANDPIAKAINEIVTKAGYRMELQPQIHWHSSSGYSDPNAIVSISAVERIFNTGMLPNTLNTIKAAWPSQPSFFLKAELMLGMAAFLRLYPESHEDRLTDMLSKFSPHVILANANRGAATGGRGTIWQHVVEDVRSIYNRNARGGRLPPRDVSFYALRAKQKAEQGEPNAKKKSNKK